MCMGLINSHNSACFYVCSGNLIGNIIIVIINNACAPGQACLTCSDAVLVEKLHQHASQNSELISLTL